MASKAQKIRVGLFTAIAAGLLALIVVVFGGMRFWEGRDTYLVVFDGSVYGLETGAHVYLNGMRVGTVTDLEPAPDDLRRVKVTIKVARDTPVHTDTHAMLQYAGITGLKVIDLRGGSRDAPLLVKGGTIAQGETALDKLQEQAEALADRSVELMTRATKIVDNLVALTDPQRFAAIDDIMSQTRTAAGNLAASSAALSAIVGENRVALRQSIESIGAAARRTASLVGDNEGTLRAALFDLRQASRSLKELVRDVRQRPSRLLFSDTPADRKLP